MFGWIRRRLNTSRLVFNLEDEVARCFAMREPVVIPPAALFALFVGSPELDEARAYASREHFDLASEALLEHFRERIHPLFFINHAEQGLITPKVSQDTAYCQAILSRANSVLAGQYDIRGFGEQSQVGQIDWLTDFGEGSWPKAHVNDLRETYSSQSPLLGQKLPIECTWELNEHSHFTTLIKAYWLSGSANFAGEFIVQAAGWSDGNPPQVGVNWLNPDTIATRLVNWLSSLNMALGSEQLSPELLRKILESMVVHAAILAWHLRNNPESALSWCSALYIFCLAFPELRLSQRWLQLSLPNLLRAANREIGVDGMHLSGHMAQQRLACEWLLLPVTLHILNKAMPPQALEDCAQRTLKALHSLYAVGSTADNIGLPASAGFLGQLATGAEHTRRILGLGALTLRVGDWCQAIHPMPNELYWWFGPNADESYNSLIINEPGYTRSLFAESGIAAVRDQWGDKSTVFYFRGPSLNTLEALKPQPNRCGNLSAYPEFHDDTLSISAAIEDEPFILEPGTPLGPNSPIELMSRLAMHSLPLIPGEHQPLPRCGNGRQAAQSLSQAASQPLPPVKFSPINMKCVGSETLLSCERQAITAEGTYSIRRELLFRPTIKMAIIRDTVTGVGDYVPFESYLLLSPKLYLMMRGDMGCSVRGQKLRAKIIPILPPRSRHNTYKASMSPFLGWYMDEDNQLAQATCLRYSAKLPLPGSAYLLISWDHKEPSLPNAENIDRILNTWR